jgi:hypothetical protein
MGRAMARPEDADSWGEFHARLEFEMDGLHEPGLLPLWWVLGVLAFIACLVSWGYALEHGMTWLWPIGLAALGVAGLLAARALDRAERRQARLTELERMWEAWRDHLQGGRPSW